jgi:hypothetical protein
MNIKDVLKKVAEGKELTKEEKDFLSSYEENSGDGKIPKERLDREIAKRKDVETKLAETSEALEEIKGRMEELETKGMPEKDKLTKDMAKLAKQVETLTGERDGLKADLDGMKFSGTVAKLAAENNFTDPEYLGYLVKSKKLAVDDPEAVKTFVGDLKKSSPKLFKVDTSSGAGTQQAGSGSSSTKAGLKTVEEKVAFIKEHGAEAFEKALAEAGAKE